MHKAVAIEQLHFQSLSGRATTTPCIRFGQPFKMTDGIILPASKSKLISQLELTLVLQLQHKQCQPMLASKRLQVCLESYLVRSEKNVESVKISLKCTSIFIYFSSHT